MKSNRAFIAILIISLVIVVAFLFRDTFDSGKVLFANDGPLGALVTRSLEMPDAFGGIWSDTTWLGSDGGRAAIGLTYPLLWLLGPVGFAKFYVPCALIIVGLCASYYFRRLGFAPAVCILGGLAAALNSNFFSNACWGLATRALSLAAIFLALAAVQSGFSSRPFLKAVLAGLAIGFSIAEGGDNGAIFSLFVAAYAFWSAWCQPDLPVKRILKGGAIVALMAVFAAVVAAQTLNVFVGSAVKGIVGVEQSGMSKEAKWNWATQWSLPKMESLRVVVPGLYGYRLDTPGGGNYRGGVGQDPAYETTKQGFPRHSGAGEYAGVLVVLIALWALAHSFVAGGAFTDKERRMIWFWGVAALVALVLSWGRHAPFYQVIYALPYFSTIRNPMKFMHPCHLALMILFAYGLQGLWRRYLEPVTAGAAKVKAAAALAFEKKWMIASGVAVAVAVLGFLIFASSRAALARHIGDAGFEPPMAAEMARFSAREVGWSVFFLFASVVAVLLISKGAFAGPRSRWAVVVLGVILVWDLSRANAPWIQYYDYKDKYASNPVLEVLAAKPYEGRTTMALSMCITPREIESLQTNYAFSQAWMGIQQIFGVEWLQHQFPYYNIQALDQPQEPRMAADKQAYREALMGRVARLYELTNTRFIVGTGGNFADALNHVFDPQKRRFRTHTSFNLFFRNPETRTIGARLEQNGPFALIEFTGALPRAKLYTQWQTSSNVQATLAKLADPAFDPYQSVLVADSIPAPEASTGNAAPGTVEFASYAPKRIGLKANATAPSVLLLNDKFDPGWKVSVDGKPAALLHCNFLMRGVQLPAGQHTVVFQFEPASKIFNISLGATLLGLVLCGFIWWDERRQRNGAATPRK